MASERQTGTTKMKAFLTKFIYADGDPTKQLLDLIFLLAYLSFAFYAGGYMYSASYFSVFEIDATRILQSHELISMFVSRVLLSSPSYKFLGILFLLIFVIVYYAARYVWRPWFGFLVLTTAFSSVFVYTIWLGEKFGRNAAKESSSFKNNPLPNIQVYLQKKLFHDNLVAKERLIEYSQAGYRLLLDTADELYLFKPPQDEKSVAKISVLPKKLIADRTVTINLVVINEDGQPKDTQP